MANTTTTYTAQYQVNGYRVTLVNNGCAAVGTAPALPADGYVNTGTQITGLSATPSAGGTFSNAAIVYVDPSAGTSFTSTVNSLPLVNPISVTLPVTITITCAAAATVNVNLNSVPANIGATLGFGAAAGTNTVSASLPASSVQTLSAAANVFSTATGVGYQFGRLPLWLLPQQHDDHRDSDTHRGPRPHWLVA